MQKNNHSLKRFLLLKFHTDGIWLKGDSAKALKRTIIVVWKRYG
jgi:hypothetical protein